MCIRDRCVTIPCNSTEDQLPVTSRVCTLGGIPQAPPQCIRIPRKARDYLFEALCQISDGNYYDCNSTK
eukprot:5614449-Amphidinium_carterae.1